MWALTVSAAGLLGGPLTARRPVSVARAHVRAVATSPELPTADRKQAAKERLNIRIDDEWYDLTNWRMAHPAGAHWIDAYKDATSGEPTFCGHPLDRVSSPAGLEHRWELARPVWEAACNTTRLVRRYIRVAADAAVTAGYVPTRAGILDPLLRDPTTVCC